jgi:hypothetical protein
MSIDDNRCVFSTHANYRAPGIADKGFLTVALVLETISNVDPRPLGGGRVALLYTNESQCEMEKDKLGVLLRNSSGLAGDRNPIRSRSPSKRIRVGPRETPRAPTLTHWPLLESALSARKLATQIYQPAGRVDAQLSKDELRIRGKYQISSLNNSSVVFIGIDS